MAAFTSLITLFFFLTHLCLTGHWVVCQQKKSSKKEKAKGKGKQEFVIKKKLHKLKYLTNQAIRRLADSSDSYDEFNAKYLSNILRVRVPGTIGHHEVKLFIIDQLTSNGWHVELDEFVDTTPLGHKRFTNIVAKLNPKAERQLAVAAHYDSKMMMPEHDRYFLAATDSAVPCAMMLDFAKLLADNKKKLGAPLADVSPMLLFLDGEEAFVHWSKNDSIYGSRHLADVFADTPHHTVENIKFSESIDAFVLLDLLGMANARFYDLYPETSHMYSRLQLIEQSMHRNGQLSNDYAYFVGKTSRGIYIEDDHVPFLRKGIPILHVISIPFPSVWHKLTDDETALDPDTINDLLKIFRQFLLEYFHLS